MVQHIKKLTFFALALITISVQAQTKKPLDTRVNVLFGLNQPLLLKGYNVEANFFYKRLAFDFSHGVSLDFSGSGVTGDAAEQNLSIHLPYSTGFGVGYRFTEAFNIRVEPKWHQFELYYENEAQTNANRIGKYNTFSLGIGAYYNWLPFKNKNNALRGIMIAPSVRYWPTVSSSLKDDKLVYENKLTGKTETHERMQPGIANTPIVVNVSIGYSFAVKKKNS